MGSLFSFFKYVILLVGYSDDLIIKIAENQTNKIKIYSYLWIFKVINDLIEN